ncbi:hypothetical protein BC830DRAFT_1129137 [Chytriomyces sp. MP71]|nr:hypothetical protein BC830DRAFT_1129137 [Chytriomyces sp. MP71]
MTNRIRLSSEGMHPPCSYSKLLSCLHVASQTRTRFVLPDPASTSAWHLATVSNGCRTPSHQTAPTTIAPLQCQCTAPSSCAPLMVPERPADESRPRPTLHVPQPASGTHSRQVVGPIRRQVRGASRKGRGRRECVVLRITHGQEVVDDGELAVLEHIAVEIAMRDREKLNAMHEAMVRAWRNELLWF